MPDFEAPQIQRVLKINCCKDQAKNLEYVDCVAHYDYISVCLALYLERQRYRSSGVT